MKRKIAFCIFLFSVLCWSCNNDFDINDTWKDNTIVYGILNKADSLQIIRVSKSFLGKGNAYDMAQISDSIYYNKPVSVKLEEWLNGNLHKTIILHKDSSMARDSGVFAYDKNYYFVTSELLNTNATYKLLVQVNNKTVTGETNLVNDFYMDVPSTINFSTTGTIKIKITSSPYARIYQSFFRFYYYELTSTDTIKKYIDFVLPTYMTTTIDGGEIFNIEYPGARFYEYVANTIQYNSNVIKRYAAKGSIVIYAFAGSNELYAYMQASGPTSGLVLDKPIYSNIGNGIGLFTSRISKYMPAKSLSQRTVDSLAQGVYTKDLLFQTYWNTSTVWDNFP